jgi:hypothetical protein
MDSGGQEAERSIMDSIQGFENESKNQGGPNKVSLDVQVVIKTAEDELRQLMRDRAEIMKRIGTIKQTIFGLVKLFGPEVANVDLPEFFGPHTNGRQPGFTRACRMVLMEAAAPLAAREVCEQIQQRKPPMIHHHKDPLASVTTVLNRLVEYGEARSVVGDNGRRAWQWVADPARNSNSLSAAD